MEFSVRGIILCGGKATRLPNKPLLPMHDLRPLICSSVDYLRRNGIHFITLACDEDNLIPNVLRRTYPDTQFDVSICTDGVGPAIRQAVVDFGDPEGYVVLCCDNIYPVEPIPDEMDVAVTREVPYEDLIHLSRHCIDGTWVDRSGVIENTVALTTPWVLSAHTALRLTSVPESFNDLNIVGYEMPRQEWADLGTDDTYRRYWDESPLRGRSSSRRGGRTCWSADG